MRRDDVRGEQALGLYLDRYLYEPLIREGFYDRVIREVEIPLQKKGIDLTIVKDGRAYKADEKAQLHYIGDPKESFPFELSRMEVAANSRVDGWFLWEDSETDLYVLIWIWDAATTKLNRIVMEDFSEVEVMVLEKARLKEWLASQAVSEERLREMTEQILREKRLSLVPEEARSSGGRSSWFLTRSADSPEASVNLIVGKSRLEALAMDHFYVSRQKSFPSMW